MIIIKTTFINYLTKILLCSTANPWGPQLSLWMGFRVPINPVTHRQCEHTSEQAESFREVLIGTQESKKMNNHKILIFVLYSFICMRLIYQCHCNCALTILSCFSVTFYFYYSANVVDAQGFMEIYNITVNFILYNSKVITIK